MGRLSVSDVEMKYPSQGEKFHIFHLKMTEKRSRLDFYIIL